MLFFERPDSGEKSVLVNIAFKSGQSELEDDLSEFQLLADSAGAVCVGLLTGVRQSPDPKYFLGSGKLEELEALVAAEQAELVMFNHTLSPSQQRNLERYLRCRIIDRTGLILDIFAQRARTFEGKLQVELAQLEHLATQLVRGWTHLERQKGGIGLRGPGETQLESDRRMIRARIKSLNQKLQKVRAQRHQNRRARKKADIFTISCVGYTNAGKSTLFNRLTQSDIYAADQLFATLDPTLRKLELPRVEGAVLADTVGFIKHLPHKLVEAFYATLEECCESDLLLHVVDASDPRKDEMLTQVEAVLAEIGADSVPQLMVYNKIDLLDGAEPEVVANERGIIERVSISAQDGLGLDELRAAISSRIREDAVQIEIKLTPEQSGIRAALFRSSAIVSEHYDEMGNNHLSIDVSHRELMQIVKAAGVTLEQILEQ